MKLDTDKTNKATHIQTIQMELDTRQNKWTQTQEKTKEAKHIQTRQMKLNTNRQDN